MLIMSIERDDQLHIVRPHGLAFVGISLAFLQAARDVSAGGGGTRRRATAEIIIYCETRNAAPFTTRNIVYRLRLESS